MTSLSTTITVPCAALESLPAHPRLFARREKWQHLRTELLPPQSDPNLAQVFRTLVGIADQLLATPPVAYIITGKRLLDISREALMRISILASVSRLVDDSTYTQRAMRELESVIEFPDWNPSHFLDVGEMALAVAIGYDWLFDDLSPDLRLRIEAAILDKALRPSFLNINSDCWWICADSNWNQVCHAGLAIAALAIGDEHPEIARTVVDRALACLPIAAHAYAPDGAYAEGPAYWGYGTSYQILLADALLQATGETHGLESFPGFLESADYLQHMTAPSGTFFNYGDSRETRAVQLPLFWMAARRCRPDWIGYDLHHLATSLQNPRAEYSRLLPLFLFWYDPKLTPPSDQPSRDCWHGNGRNPVAVLRSIDQSVYFAIKAGCPADSHAHMDAGSFVLETHGIRWAIDLGMQDYHSLESTGMNIWSPEQSSDRWRVFRMGSESHNILRLDHAAQQVTGRASFLTFDPERRFTTLDLTPLYSDHASRVHRGARLVENAILLQDEWDLIRPDTTVSWQFLTQARVELREDGWLLSQDGHHLTIRIMEPSLAKMDCLPVDSLLHPYDHDCVGVSRLSITASAARRLQVLFIPGDSLAELPFPDLALPDWN